MKAAVLHEVGKPFSVEDVTEPEAGEGQSVVEVRAAGINFADVLIRNGQYPQPPPLPVVLGNEVAGDVDGRRVVAFVRGSGGGYAEKAVVGRRVDLRPSRGGQLRGRRGVSDDLSDRVDPVDAAGHLHPDSNVLVTAAAGGVGTAAIQVAVFAGANVTRRSRLGGEARARAPARRDSHGVVRGDRRAGRHRRGVDPVGGRSSPRASSSLRPLGAAIGIGFAGGAWEPVDPARLVGRNVGVLGFYLGRLMGFRADIVQQEVAELLALWRRGALRPVVGAEFPLEQVNEAQEADRVAEVDREGRSCSLRPRS